MSLADALPHRHPHPDEHAARRELGRAHLWSGDAARAIEALAPLHRVRPWDREVQHLMLDALFVLGRTESDYPWTLEPVVVRVGPGLLDRLHGLLVREGNAVTVLDLLLAATEEGYAAFRAVELLRALEGDRRFTVRRAGLAPECAVVACAAGDRPRPVGCPAAPPRSSAAPGPGEIPPKIGHLPE